MQIRVERSITNAPITTPSMPFTFDTADWTQEQINMIPAALGFFLFNSKGISYDDITCDNGVYTVVGLSEEIPVSTDELLATVIEQQAAERSDQSV